MDIDGTLSTSMAPSIIINFKVQITGYNDTKIQMVTPQYGATN